MAATVVITRSPRPGAPGIEVATWRHAEGTGRCVVARTDIADPRWQQLADVVVCPPQAPSHDPRRELRDALTVLPACVVSAAGWGDYCAVIVRGVGEFTLRDSRRSLSAADYAVWCYAWVVPSDWPGGSVGPSASNRACT